MKTAAIIAEYNPFHNGHKYQIEETKRLTGADFILVVMSGDFVQRGAPAAYNKYLRTRMALLGGADAVLELPSLYAVSSAEFFAGGSIALLNCLGMVDYLSFGSECGEIPLLMDCARLLASEPSAYSQNLSFLLKQGLSFPAARNKAILQTIDHLTLNRKQSENILPSEKILNRLFTLPNNILAMEYCKSLLATDSSIIPVTIKRQGNAYHEAAFSENPSFFASASAIRNILETMYSPALEKSCKSASDALSLLRANLPGEIYDLLVSETLFEDFGTILTCDDFSSLLHYKLLMERWHGFAGYLDCDSDFSDKILKNLPAFTDFTGFSTLLKSKDVTYANISRILTHILLGVTTPDHYRQPFSERKLSVPYARLLGFKKDSPKLLSAIKKNSSIPLISKLADAKNFLNRDALAMLDQDILASDIYESVFSKKYKKRPPVNEYRQSPVIL